MSREAYNRQIDVIMSEFAPVMRRYARLLAAEQGLDKVSLADIKMPFSKEPAETISIKASRAMVEDTFKVLGPDYQEIVRRAFDERWIDYPMNQTKSTGGFCATVAIFCLTGQAYSAKCLFWLTNWGMRGTSS